MAAGLGFKTFTTGEVLTAADVNGYLMQGVLVFASAAARNAAITSPQEGQFAFTKDTNGLWYYDGAAWVASGATGDIEGVTAGVGISGGGTSGTVTVTNDMATTITTKGDLVPGTGSGTYARLAAGANNTVLTADSTTATGLKWAAAAGGGKVLQVIQGSQTGVKSSASSTYADTSLTATITPTSASSKVLVMVSHEACGKTADTSTAALQIKLMRDSTEISNSGDCIGNNNSTVPNIIGTVSLVELDSPATTSATTYKTQFRSVNNNSAAVIGNYFSSQVARNTIILMEIGA
jgi:hypothetical protein